MPTTWDYESAEMTDMERVGKALAYKKLKLPRPALPLARLNK